MLIRQALNDKCNMQHRKRIRKGLLQTILQRFIVWVQRLHVAFVNQSLSFTKRHPFLCIVHSVDTNLSPWRVYRIPKLTPARIRLEISKSDSHAVNWDHQHALPER